MNISHMMKLLLNSSLCKQPTSSFWGFFVCFLWDQPALLLCCIWCQDVTLVGRLVHKIGTKKIYSTKEIQKQILEIFLIFHIVHHNVYWKYFVWDIDVRLGYFIKMLLNSSQDKWSFFFNVVKNCFISQQEYSIKQAQQYKITLTFTNRDNRCCSRLCKKVNKLAMHYTLWKWL